MNNYPAGGKEFNLSEKSRKRKNLIIVLITLAIVLLVANLVVNRFFLHKTRVTQNILSGYEIQERFVEIVKSFGVKQSWILNSRRGAKNGDTTVYRFYIKLPADLPVPVILAELYSAFEPFDVELTASERKINGRSELKIYSNDELALAADFNFDLSLRRDARTLGFIIFSPLSIEPLILSNLLDLPEPLAAAVSPSKRAAEIVKSMTGYRKEIAVLLDDNIDDLKFRLSADYSKLRIRNVVSSIVSEFPAASFFLIDDKSEIYNSKIYPYMEAEFEKRKIKLIPLNTFRVISSDTAESLAADLNVKFESADAELTEIFIVSIENYLDIRSSLTNYRKRGYKFVYPSSLIQR